MMMTLAKDEYPPTLKASWMLQELASWPEWNAASDDGRWVVT